jgi:hypothetical protein
LQQTLSSSSGRLRIAEFQNPHYAGRDLIVTWALTDMDTTGTHLNGWAHLEQGPGLLQNIDRLIATTPTAKLALTPLMLLINLDRQGVFNLGLPDLRRWPIESLDGHYRFKAGVMSIEPFVLQSPLLSVDARGTVELDTGILSGDVKLRTPSRRSSGAMDARIRLSGTVSKPRVDISSLKKKAFRASITGALQKSVRGLKF